MIDMAKAKRIQESMDTFGFEHIADNYGEALAAMAPDAKEFYKEYYALAVKVKDFKAKYPEIYG